MSIKNNQRILVQLIREIAKEKGIECHIFSHDWIIQLQKGNQKRLVYGYNFDLNSAATQLIAKDKNATSTLLFLNHIPNVEHYLLLNPRLSRYISDAGNWPQVQNILSKHPFPIVCKPNMGTGGNQVYFAHNQQDLELALHNIFQSNRGAALSPYQNIEAELRFIILNNTVQFAYKKTPPYLVGDGQSDILKLLQAYLKKRNLHLNWSDIQIPFPTNKVLGKGEICPFSSKHNLGKGATAEVVQNPELEQLALKAADAIQLNIGAIDIIQTPKGHKVLEINSGLMMESLVKCLPDGRAIAKRIYSNTIEEMFGG